MFYLPQNQYSAELHTLTSAAVFMRFVPAARVSYLDAIPYEYMTLRNNSIRMVIRNIQPPHVAFV